ncbi:MAG: hypothetical protein PUA61_06275 [Succinatimonas hippei]|nr:hypothetical protein [Succinatimonas hippei]
MKAVIFESDPLRSAVYEQGIELCGNLLDMGEEVTAFISGNFAEAYENAPEDAEFKRKFSQLELYGAKLAGDPTISAESRILLNNCGGAISF